MSVLGARPVVEAKETLRNEQATAGGIDAIDDGCVIGWLAAPKGARSIRFDLYADDRLVWFERDAGEPRPDMSIDGAKRLGFVVSLPPDVTRAAAVIRITASGEDRVLAEARIRTDAAPAPRPPSGAAEAIDDRTVAVWLPVAKGKSSAHYDVYLDTRLILADQETDAQGPALAEGAATRGFTVKLPNRTKSDASLRITPSGAKRVLFAARLDALRPAAPRERASKPPRRPAPAPPPHRREIAEDKGVTIEIEEIGATHISGHLADARKTDSALEIALLVDEIFYAKIKCAPDSSGRAAWSVGVPPSLLEQAKSVTILAPDGTRTNQPIAPSASPSARGGDALGDPLPVLPRVSVAVPIFNAFDDVRACLERLLRYTPSAHRIILLDDASDDPRMKTLLREAQNVERVVLHENAQNLGFTRTANIGVALAESDDVVLLNSDTRVTPRWLENLREAAYSSARIATATPMSDRAGAFSAPEIGQDNPLPPGVGEEAFALEFRRASRRFFPEVPTGNGFCLYVKRAAFDSVGHLDEQAFPRGYGEENDFCMRAMRAGWRHIIDDSTYIFHERAKSFGDARPALIAKGREAIDARYPDYGLAIKTFGDGAALLGARYHARLALRDSQRPGAGRERLLLVGSALRDETLDDVMRALTNDFEIWTLEADADEIRLARYENGRVEPIDRRRLTSRMNPREHRLLEYECVAASWLRAHDFALLHISSFIHHSLSLPEIAKRFGAKVTVSFDDYYTACPTATLLDENRIFCGGACTLSGGDCPTDLWPRNSFPRLKNGWVMRWRALFAAALAECDGFIAPSEDARRLMLSTHPALDERSVESIPSEPTSAARRCAFFLRALRCAE